MKKIYESVGKVVIEYEPETKTYISNWGAYFGPHFRESLEALMLAVKTTGLVNYIANASKATDVPTQENFTWGAEVFKPALVAGGIRRYITVEPTSGIAMLGANRFYKVAQSQAGVETYKVATLDDALKLAKPTFD